jgi:hypothetical protein
MYIFVDREDIKIYSNTEPDADSKEILPTTKEYEIDRINKKPYINKKNVMFTINDKYNLFFDTAYDWDGASIPFGFRWMLGGKGNPKFLIPSMVHDKMCECPWLVDYDRELSSKVLYEMLLASKVSKFIAKAMYYSVELYQKTKKKWKRK